LFSLKKPEVVREGSLFPSCGGCVSTEGHNCSPQLLPTTDGSDEPDDTQNAIATLQSMTLICQNLVETNV